MSKDRLPAGITGTNLGLWSDREHALARALYSKMEEIDPVSGAPDWELLDAGEKVFYLRCIEAVMDEIVNLQRDPVRS